MDINECNTNHLVANVLLPPRKRLLEDPSPSPLSPVPLSQFDLRVINNLLKSYKNGSNISPQEIVKAAGLAATAAAQAVQVVRAIAEERASIALKAMAAANSALDSVASISKDTSTQNLATIDYGMSMGNDTGKFPLAHNGDAIEVGMDCERSNEESYITKVDDKVSKSSRHDEIEVDNCEAETSHSKGRLWNYITCVPVAGREVELSRKVTSKHMFKDQANATEELNLTNTPRADKSSADHVSSLSVELS
ncbi:LOW QUALITY PROTEIN: hypothetical protein Cgig2_001642 [Carnegiea gigantea]|uniref:Uncharacterized protein n=1 Tax=Carnegiea gigantea TaxID=171969 RepID=A0A9Q1GYR4_9CARY|nr:LOW QUALITY PROTEIN: hypothetical protein Cgig2_001642 [Carnegiea gigantea]